MTDAWNPQQYERFRNERMQPFDDLLALIQIRPGMRIIDLGCGTGELTAMLAERFPESQVLGIDSSSAMLQKADAFAKPHVRFEQADIQAFTGYDAYDLVFSHAAFQWVPDNEALMRRILAQLKPGAQVAVQMPKNDRHVSHKLAAEVAQETPFRDWLGGYIRESCALELERYAELFHEQGVRPAICVERIYGHVMASAADVVEWVKGTLLTAYLSRLTAEQGEAFIGRYRERLMAALGPESPYFYAFRRMLLAAKKPD